MSLKPPGVGHTHRLGIWEELLVYCRKSVPLPKSTMDEDRPNIEDSMNMHLHCKRERVQLITFLKGKAYITKLEDRLQKLHSTARASHDNRKTTLQRLKSSLAEDTTEYMMHAMLMKPNTILATAVINPSGMSGKDIASDETVELLNKVLTDNVNTIGDSTRDIAAAIRLKALRARDARVCKAPLQARMVLGPYQAARQGDDKRGLSDDIYAIGSKKLAGVIKNLNAANAQILAGVAHQIDEAAVDSIDATDDAEARIRAARRLDGRKRRPWDPSLRLIYTAVFRNLENYVALVPTAMMDDETDFAYRTDTLISEAMDSVFPVLWSVCRIWMLRWKVCSKPKEDPSKSAMSLRLMPKLNKRHYESAQEILRLWKAITAIKARDRCASGDDFLLEMDVVKEPLRIEHKSSRRYRSSGLNLKILLGILYPEGRGDCCIWLSFDVDTEQFPLTPLDPHGLLICHGYLIYAWATILPSKPSPRHLPGS
ncbi:hypothetical protein AC579_2070 [Pseudocercospora musae]|uniref:Uncharacterized protein n=1 Tax=Pseudocercospora musae TaxID=113226 RepID=A0A139GUW0_9PEZI|nr:hypothetical protein AC579_2070 [Pseudocercospora musae]